MKFSPLLITNYVMETNVSDVWWCSISSFARIIVIICFEWIKIQTLCQENVKWSVEIIVPFGILKGLNLY